MPEPAQPVDATIDARAPGLAAADLIFVFGTRLADPARIAGDLFRQRMAPFVVLTGGSVRQPDGLNEAEHHRDLLLAAGMPADSIILENRSSSTAENVLFALPLIEQRCPKPRSVIAVVKRNHRRALVTLARHTPSLQRIYAVDYAPVASPDRTDKELRYMRDLRAAGFDLLIADGSGWRRSDKANDRASRSCCW